MALRQRLPRLGARLLRGLAAEAEASAAAAPQRAASLQCARTFSRLAGPRCLRQLASTGAVSVLAARQAPPSALLSLASLRQFAAAADLPAFQVLLCCCWRPAAMLLLHPKESAARAGAAAPVG